MGAVKCADFIWETKHCSKLPFDVGLVSHSARELDELTTNFYNPIPLHFKMAGIIEFRDSCDIPDLR